MLCKTILTLDGFTPAFLGYYIKGDDWNGWEYAHFELSEALKVAEENNKNAEYPMEYDPIYDQFYMWDEGNEDYYFIKGHDVRTDEGVKHLYGIGAGCWTWDKTEKSTIRYVAQEVEEFIFYHDTYNYWDEYDNRREEVVDRLIEQLADLNILVQAMNIMRNEDLTEEARFSQLGEILKV